MTPQQRDERLIGRPPQTVPHSYAVTQGDDLVMRGGRILCWVRATTPEAARLAAARALRERAMVAA